MYNMLLMVAACSLCTVIPESQRVQSVCLWCQTCLTVTQVEHCSLQIVGQSRSFETSVQGGYA